MDCSTPGFPVHHQLPELARTHVHGVGDARWWSRRMWAHHFLWEPPYYNSLLNIHPQEDVGSHQNKIPHIQRQRRSPSKMVWSLILNVILPPNHLAGSSTLPLDMRYLFLMGSNIFLLMVVQQRVVILEFSQKKMSAYPSTLPSCCISKS